MSLRAWWFSAVMAMAPGCVAYNEQCVAPIDAPNERVAFVAQGTQIFLDRPNTRHGANALGQAAADAFVDAFSSTAAPAQLGLLNGGALRGEGICGASRSILREGPLTNGVLHEIILFENLVRAVDLTEPELIAALEHSAGRLVLSPAPIVSPAGSFLQVSKEVQLEIDCAKAPGSRLVSLRIGGEAATLPMGRATKRWRVGLPAFLLTGGDGYTMLVTPGSDPDRNPATAQRFGGIDSNVTADYLRRNFNRDVASGLRLDTGRMTLTNCSVPGPPTN